MLRMSVRNIGLLFLTLLTLAACGSPTSTLAPTGPASSSPTTAAQTSATTVVSATTVTTASSANPAVTASAAVSAASSPTLPTSVATGSSVITITIAPIPTVPLYTNPNLDFFYNYPNSTPLTVSTAAKEAFTASAAQTIKTESIKVELYTTSDDPAKIFKSFADAAQAKGFRVARQDNQVVAVINDQTKEIGQATIIPLTQAITLLGITPDAVKGGIIYVAVTGKLLPSVNVAKPSATVTNTVTSSSTP